MTLKVAKLMLVKGKKMTHHLFLDDEYIKIENGNLIDEEGVILDSVGFWKVRSKSIFKNGWKIYKK